MKNTWRTHSIGIFILVGLMATFVLADQMEMVTYYPAPSGSVPDPLFVSKMSVGASYKRDQTTVAPIIPDSSLIVEGRVGIGLKTPSAKLEVVGDANTSFSNHLVLTNTNNDAAGIVLDAANRDWAIGATNPASGFGDQKLVFYDVTSNAARMVIDSTGKVGIGTTSPAYMLDVADSMVFRGNRLYLPYNLPYSSGGANPDSTSVWFMSGGTGEGTNRALGFDPTNKQVYIGGPGWSKTVLVGKDTSNEHWLMAGGTADGNKALGFDSVKKQVYVGGPGPGWSRTVFPGTETPVDQTSNFKYHYFCIGGDELGWNTPFQFRVPGKKADGTADPHGLVFIGPGAPWDIVMNQTTFLSPRTYIIGFDGDNGGRFPPAGVLIPTPDLLGWHWFTAGGTDEHIPVPGSHQNPDTHQDIVGYNYMALGFSPSRQLLLTNWDMSIGQTGNSKKLWVNGDLTISGTASKPGGGEWSISSDIRLKKDISTLNGALAKLLQLQGVNFRWKNPEKEGHLTGVQTGFIGQEVEKVFPEWISEDRNGYKLLTIRGFDALTVESLRELKAEDDLLKAENKELKSQLKGLQEKVDTLLKNSSATSSGR